MVLERPQPQVKMSSSPELPVWLLDIDGVLNAVATYEARRYLAWPESEWIQFEADSGSARWKINAATPVANFIRRVHESGLAEIRWHTTWQQHALGVGSQLGLPEFPVHDAPEYDSGFWRRMRGSDSWWKLPGARRVVQLEDRPLIWTDDDITYEMNRQQRNWLRNEGTVLLISPDSHVGLMQSHLDKIDRFLNPSFVEEK
jgi:hypothetical protein